MRGNTYLMTVPIAFVCVSVYVPTHTIEALQFAIYPIMAYSWLHLYLCRVHM